MRKYLLAVAVVCGMSSGMLLACGGGGGGGPIGVEKCDRFIAKGNACAKKLGDKGKDLQTVVDMKTDMWKTSKSGPNKDMLPDFCEMQLESSKGEYPDCEW